jgi:tetratricopeptide (TPR) repeat protein
MDFNGYVNQGIAFFQKNEYEPAIRNFRAALELNPDNQEIRGFIGMIEGKIRMEAQASQAVANEARQRADIMGIQVEDVDNVITEYTEALKHNPNDDSVKNSLASAYYIRGLTFTSKKEHARAIADYSEAIKNNPNYPHAFNKRGRAYSDSGDFDKAIADYEELRRLDPNYNMLNESLASVYMGRGMAHDKKGDYGRAVEDYEKVLQLNPNKNSVRELLEMAKAEKAKRQT